MASLLAAGGVSALSLRGFELGSGELLTLLAAVLYAAHIVALGRWTSPGTAYALTVVQLLTMGVCFLAVAAPRGVSLPTGGDWTRFLYLAIIVGGLTMLVQTWAQAHISAAHVAVLMVLEPVWAAVFGTTFWGEQLTARIIVGAGLVLLGLLIITTGSRGAPMAPPGAGEGIPVPAVTGTDRDG
jgi:drug/metabolite transporter (DMT)-like permease